MILRGDRTVRRRNSSLKVVGFAKQKSVNIRTLRNKAWKIFSEYVRRRDEGKCITCGKQDDWKAIDAGHFVPAGSCAFLRFNELNVNGQCTYCNRYLHGNLYIYGIKLDQKYGPGTATSLQANRHQKFKPTAKYYENIIRTYTLKIKSL